MSIETPRWAESVESLLSNGRECKVCDVLIIGSGYGGSFAARELAGSGDVWVVERGREYALGEFPEDIGSLPGHVRFSRRSKPEITGKPEALFDFRVFDDVSMLVANGLGGGSLINAGVALQPDREAIAAPDWPSALTGERRKNELFCIMGEVSNSLQASELCDGKELQKFHALKVLAKQAKWPEPTLVPLTIASEGRTNSVGLDQKACTRCGNCLTGCNVGAKNTLVSHVIPEAVRKGARFFTGGTALHLEPWDGQPLVTDNGRPVRWRVKFARTLNAKGKAGQAPDFEIAAHVVILSAGALGSTELLLRSPSVTHSNRLGENFSTNGDLIAMGWGMKEKINGISAPRADSSGPSNNVGPTIVGTIRAPLKEGSKEMVLLQDGAVPSALAQSAIALGTALSTAHRYTRSPFPDGFPSTADPLSTPAAIGEHALVLLGMGKDPGRAKVSLVEAKDTSGKKSRVLGNLQVQWSDVEKKKSHRYHKDFDELLLRAEKAGALQGGDYLSNPAWRPFPKEFSAVSGDPPHKMVTVHPLGGCPMGDDSRTGVVDWKGAVFTGNGGQLHAGLHVMDGAMLPASLGVNPFLTISALSVLAARHLRAELDQTRRSSEPRPGRALPAQQPAVPLLDFQPAGPIVLSFEERLQGTVAGETPAWLDALAVASWPGRPDYTAQRDWVVKVKVTLDLHAWLADPAMPLNASLKLYENRFPHESSAIDEAVQVTPLLEGFGTVTLLALEKWPLSTKESSHRSREAYATYLERRSRLDLKSATSGDNPITGIQAFWRAGRNHGWQRLLTYKFDLTQPSAKGGPVFKATGEKRLAYARGEKNVWHALTQLDLQLSPALTATDAVKMRLKVDLVDMVRNNRLQIVTAPNTPAAIVGLASFASLWVRAIFTTHFWSFRGSIPLVMPPPAQHERLWPDGPLEASVEPCPVRIQVPIGSAASGDPINLELTRYQPKAVEPSQPRQNSKHVLLIHGLAHGGTVFTTDTIGHHNMATAFLKNGYTVWVLDHRLSNRLPYRLQNHTMDDLAAHDIPVAIRHVFREAGCKIKVFAHCVGAAAFSMAALSGRLHCASGSMIESAVIHAVHPWLVPSASNQLSAALAALYKDLLEDDDSVDPLPRDKSWVLRGLRKKDESDDPLTDDEPRMFERILDRFAATIPWSDGEMERHERHKYDPQGGCAVCNRMTVFYGREWVHANLADATHEQLGSLVGSAGIEVFRQLFFVLTRERLTDRQGNNAYLTQDRVRQHFTFPVLFAHGRENQVFDPRGAVRSWNRLIHLRKHFKCETAVKLFIAKGYGHMDFLFGKDAHLDIYPQLIEFFEKPDAFKDTWKWREKGPPHPPSDADWELSDFDYHTPRSLLTGPLIQLDKDVEGKKQLVVWFEQSQHTTSEATPPTLTDAEVPDGAKAFDWRAVNLKTRIQSDMWPPMLLNGAGVYWTATLNEAFPSQFSGLPTTRVGLGVQDPDIKNVTFGLGLSHRLMPLRGTDFEMQRQVGARRFTGDMSPSPPIYDSQLAAELNWSGLPWWKRWTGAPVEAPVSWLASSCRWPGLPFEREGADLLACAMLAHVTDAKLPVDALVLLGDQIYGDATADVADTTEMEERGPKRYRDAWGGKHTRKLLASLPSYMVVDDHEFRDGWGTGDKPWLEPEFINGFHAALAYQWRWKANDALPRLTSEGVCRGFWRSFEIGSIPAFAADTRTERRAPPNPDNWEQRRLMSEAQFEAIEQWMLSHKDVPKILCSGSVFGIFEEDVVNDPSLCRSGDGWLAHPAAWRRMACFIAHHQIRNLIFLSGDLHLSAIAELQIDAVGAPAPVRALSVACSGWNATLPFANRRARDIACGDRISAPLNCPDVRMYSSSRVLSAAYRQFSKLTLQTAEPGWELQVRVYGEGNVELPLKEPCRLRL